MAQTAVIQVRVDSALKTEAESLFSDLGLDIPSAIRLFLKQSIANNGLPFPVKRRDDFYNPYNMAHLKKVYADMQAGTNFERHELIEVGDDA
jgi:DNA-damage-inducible protein J